MEGQVVDLGGAIDAEDMDTGEAFQVEAEVEGGAAPKPRRPWISIAHRLKLGRTPGCDACSRLGTGQAGRPHTPACWDRVIKIMETTEDGQSAILRAEARMEQYHSIMANGVTPENASELPAAPSTPVWPSEAEIMEADSEADGNEKEARAALTEASIDAVFRRYATQRPDGKLTKEAIRKVFEELEGRTKETAQREGHG